MKESLLSVLEYPWGINDLKQTLRAEPLIHEPSVSEVAIRIEKFRRDKSQVESLVELIKIGGTRVGT